MTGLAASSSRMLAVMPWTTNERRALEASIIDLAAQADSNNRQWAEKWFETFQFVLGNHYLKWSKKFGFAVDVDPMRSKQNGSTPKSQTNISRTVLESLASMIYSNLPDIFAESKYDSSCRGARLAKVIESLVECYNERIDLHEEFDSGSIIYTMYNKVYSCVRYNPTKGSTFQRRRQQLVQVPKMTTRLEADPVTGEEVVVPVPMMGKDGKPVMMSSYEDAIGEDGQPIVEWVQTGDTEVECLTGYEIAYDPLAKSLRRSKWVEWYRVMDYDDFMTEYGEQPGAIAEVMDRVVPGTLSGNIRNVAMRHFLRTIFAAPPSMDSAGEINLSNLFMLRNKVFVIEHFDRPTKGHIKNPTPFLKEGRRSVLVNGKLCLVSTPQYRMAGDAGWHPFAEAKWLPLAPSSHSSGPMSDTVQKNRELNLTDSLMTTALRRQAASTLLVNENSGIDKNKWTGEPGASFYTSGDPSGAVAYASDKNPLPALVQQYRAQVKDDVFEVSAAQDSIRGERSVGANSGYQARLYEEREKKRTSKASTNWSKFVKLTYQKLIACTQQNIIKLDDQVISKMLRSTDGEITQSDIIAFLNGPIDFGVDLTLKPDSMTTKSKATKIADIQEAMQIPAVADRLMRDPSVVDAYLDFLDIDVLRDVSSVHRERAKKENAIFLDMVGVKDPAKLEAFAADSPLAIWQDDDMAHMIEHMRDYVKNYDKYKRNPIMMRMFAVHQSYHEQNYKAKQKEQSPYIASTTADIVARAEASAAQPKNLLQEITSMREQLMERAISEQQSATTRAPAQAAAPAEGAEQ